MVEQKAYRDTWGRGLDSYLQWFYETAVLLRELLAGDGSIYVHLRLAVSTVIMRKSYLTKLFGSDGYRNEICWKRTNAHGNADYKFGAITDIHLVLCQF